MNFNPYLHINSIDFYMKCLVIYFYWCNHQMFFHTNANIIISFEMFYFIGM